MKKLIFLIGFLAIAVTSFSQTVRTRTYFHNKFITGYKPTQTDYRDLWASIFFPAIDTLPITQLVGVDELSNDPALADSSARALVTEAAVKAYVDAQIGGGGVSDGDKGDITVSGSGTVMTIDTGAISWLKLAEAVKDSINRIDTAFVNSVRQLANQAILGRHYDKVVVVSTTIKAALNGITDATSSNRYLVYVPNGTYTEDSLHVNHYVDLVGQSKTGVIIQSTSGTNDIIDAGGKNSLIANMTLTHTRNIGDPGVTKYPVHVDAATASGTFTTPRNSTTILYNLDINALGTQSKAGVGIGVRSSQRVYIVDCDIYAQTGPGIFTHNVTTQTLSSQVYVVNTRSEGTYGLEVQCEGSGVTGDVVSVIGGELIGSTNDIITRNGAGGAGEIFVSLYGVTYQTSSFVSADKILQYPIFTAPKSTTPAYAENEGRTYLDNSTYFALGTIGMTTTGRIGSGTESPTTQTHSFTSALDIGFLSQNYKTTGTTYAGYLQNSLGTGAGDSYGLYVLNNSTKSGVNYGINVVGATNYISGNLGIGQIAPQRKTHIYQTNGSTNAVTFPLRISASPNADAMVQAGFGTGIEFATKRNTSAVVADERVGGRIKTVITDTATASITADIVIDNVVSGTLAERLWLRGQRLGLGAAPVASAAMDINSTVAGFLQPRMTTAQRDAISIPATGLSVYNTTTNFPNFWDGTAWRQLVTSTLANATYLPLAGGTLTGNLLFTDNTLDIGASGATRPRTGYFGTSVVTPLVSSSTNLALTGTNNVSVASGNLTTVTATDSTVLIGGNTRLALEDDKGLDVYTNDTRRMTIGHNGIAENNAATKVVVLSSTDTVGWKTLQSSDWTGTVTQSGSDTLLNGAIGYGHFTRVGNIVTFTLRIEMALTVTGNANTVYIDPPIASNFTTAASDVIGVAGLDSQGLSSANTPKQRALLFASDSDDKIGISFDPVASLAYPENRVYISASGTYIIQ